MKASITHSLTLYALYRKHDAPRDHYSDCSVTSTSMAKSKNHTNHNDTQKAHKNGVRKPQPLHLFKSVRGSWLPALVNARKVRKMNQAAAIKRRKERLAKVQASFGKK